MISVYEGDFSTIILTFVEKQIVDTTFYIERLKKTLKKLFLLFWFDRRQSLDLLIISHLLFKLSCLNLCYYFDCTTVSYSLGFRNQSIVYGSLQGALLWVEN